MAESSAVNGLGNRIALSWLKSELEKGGQDRKCAVQVL